MFQAESTGAAEEEEAARQHWWAARKDAIFCCKPWRLPDGNGQGSRAALAQGLRQLCQTELAGSPLRQLGSAIALKSSPRVGSQPGCLHFVTVRQGVTVRQLFRDSQAGLRTSELFFG